MFLVFIMKAMRFSHCNKLNVKGLKHINSQKNHISINGCNDTTISDLVITAPAKSPNTDGIDISGSTKVRILNSLMATGTHFTFFLITFFLLFIQLFSCVCMLIYANCLDNIPVGYHKRGRLYCH